MQEIIIIGYGKMAKAIIEGIYHNFKIKVVGRDKNRLRLLRNEFPKIEIEKLKNIDINNKNILLAVKPYALKEVSKKLNGKAKVVISILAGVKIEKIKEVIEANSVVRVMPNIGASYNQSMTTITGDLIYRDEVIDICNSFGKSLWLNSEKELDIATAIAGSGPAYLAIIMEALIDGGVRMGLKREEASEITKGLFEGFAKVAINHHPTVIKESVMSPSGTTAEGCFVLEKSNIRATFIEAVEKAYQKALSIT